MGQQGQQQQSGGDNSMAPVWITVLLFISLYLLWYSGHQYIVAFIFRVTLFQAKIVHFFIDSKPLANEIYLMQTLDPTSVNWEQMVGLARSVGNYVRYPLVAILVFLAVYLYNSNITLRFRKTYNMQSLRVQEQHNWPCIMPVVKQDLVGEEIDKGPWAMAMTPMGFARKYQLLRKEDVLLDPQVPGQEMTAGIKRGDAKRVFTLQLGPSWDGFERCPPYVQALAAVFMARMNRDREAATKILSALDKTTTLGKPNYTIAIPTLKKYQSTQQVQRIVARHAYQLTVMASLLQASREDGVVPSAEFMWLKAVDRRLWYMLNCVGRQTPFAEVGGPFAHWKAERSMGRRSLVPMIDEAIKALEIAVKEVKISPEELEELQP